MLSVDRTTHKTLSHRHLSATSRDGTGLALTKVKKSRGLRDKLPGIDPGNSRERWLESPQGRSRSPELTPLEGPVVFAPRGSSFVGVLRAGARGLRVGHGIVPEALDFGPRGRR
jgi:hypothetical protein